MDTEQASQATLYAKLARVMGELKRLPKTGHNKHFDYKFVTDGDVADTIRELLAKENIAFFAEMVAVEQIGKKTRGQFVFTFACGDTGATRSCSWFGEADDGQDKGMSKGATSAEKYFLLKTFMISTGVSDDDPDSQGEVKDKKQAPTRPVAGTNGNGAGDDKPASSARERAIAWAKDLGYAADPARNPFPNNAYDESLWQTWKDRETKVNVRR